MQKRTMILASGERLSPLPSSMVEDKLPLSLASGY